MDIDLLITPQHQVGLLSSENLIKKAVGVLFDNETNTLSIEYVDSDHLDLNIPVEPEFFGVLDANALIQFGAVKNGKIAQAYQVPLMFLNDPYRAEAFEKIQPPKQPLQSFYYFVKKCMLGQPVHRKDAGDEDTAGCILGDAKPSALEFANHLARRHGMEVGKHAANTMNAPGMGLGSSSGGGSAQSSSHYQTRDENDDQ